MSKTTVLWLSLIDRPVRPRVCRDIDEDCPTMVSHVKCWMHAPEEGYCPWLRANGERIALEQFLHPRKKEGP